MLLTLTLSSTTHERDAIAWPTVCDTTNTPPRDLCLPNIRRLRSDGTALQDLVAPIALPTLSLLYCSNGQRPHEPDTVLIDTCMPTGPAKQTFLADFRLPLVGLGPFAVRSPMELLQPGGPCGRVRPSGPLQLIVVRFGRPSRPPAIPRRPGGRSLARSYRGDVPASRPRASPRQFALPVDHHGRTAQQSPVCRPAAGRGCCL